MKFTNKLVGSEDERAVSPVIGVILMVAITVILAAVIAAFVLDLGQSTGANAQAGVSFSEDNELVTVQITSVDRADDVYIQIEGDGDTEWLEEEENDEYDTNSDRDEAGSFDVGDSVTIDSDSIASNDDDIDDDSGLEDDDLEGITVVGELDGSDAVVATWSP